MSTTPFVPCGWSPTPVPSAGGCNDTEDPTILATAQDLATAILFSLTGRQFGCCTVTVRPCKPRTCAPLQLSRIIYWDSRTFGRENLGVMSFVPTLIGGEVYNISCGCPSGCCTCEASCEVRLPGPICTVTNVTVDGVVLDPSLYRVMDGDTLIIDSDHCPGCQDYDLAAGEVGTWTVTYSVGTPVPAELNIAAGLYANELKKAFTGDKSCQLPANVQQVTRQGVNVTYTNPLVLTQAGLTGLPLVDTIIRAVNPYSAAEPSRVWFPGKTSRVRRDTP